MRMVVAALVGGMGVWAGEGRIGQAAAPVPYEVDGERVVGVAGLDEGSFVRMGASAGSLRLAGGQRGELGAGASAEVGAGGVVLWSGQAEATGTDFVLMAGGLRVKAARAGGRVRVALGGTGVQVWGVDVEALVFVGARLVARVPVGGTARVQVAGGVLGMGEAEAARRRGMVRRTAGVYAALLP